MLTLDSNPIIMKRLLTILFLIPVVLAYSQCDTDRHNTSLNSIWMSCELNPNPNPLRGDSHWIMYDLGEVKKLGQSHFWNINNPSEISSGARQIAFSISMNGEVWDELGIWEASMANGSGLYSGEESFDLTGEQARFLLLTVLNSHGNNDCVGFAEIRVETEPITSISDLAEEETISVFPNPASGVVNVSYPENWNGSRNLQLVDINGKMVLDHQVKNIVDQTRISLEGISSGQYFLRSILGSSGSQVELTIINN